VITASISGKYSHYAKSCWGTKHTLLHHLRI
jgi:hypothetical protein